MASPSEKVIAGIADNEGGEKGNISGSAIGSTPADGGETTPSGEINP